MGQDLGKRHATLMRLNYNDTYLSSRLYIYTMQRENDT